MPIGSRVFLRLGHRYTRAILETTVVDPGREYFYDLSRYTFNATTAAARVDLGPRLFGEAEADWVWTRFDQTQPGGFFDYDTRTLRAGLGYDVGSDLRATVSYAYERIPPSPDRAIVETTAHSLLGTLAGTIGPLTTGSLTVGFRRQTNPLATGESASFEGFTLGGSLRRELGHSSSVELQWNRAADPSSYDTNAYYVTNSLVASLSVPAPFEVWARGSVGLLRNNYPNDAPGLDAPRRDDILGWTRRPRAAARLADVGPRRLPPRAPRLQPARLRRDHGRFRRAARRGPLRPGILPPMIATLVLLALLQAPPPAAAGPPPLRPPSPPRRRLRGRPRRRHRGGRLRQRRPLAHPHRADERLHLAPAPGRGPGGRAHDRRGAAQDHEPPGEGLPGEARRSR